MAISTSPLEQDSRIDELRHPRPSSSSSYHLMQEEALVAIVMHGLLAAASKGDMPIFRAVPSGMHIVAGLEADIITLTPTR